MYDNTGHFRIYSLVQREGDYLYIIMHETWKESLLKIFERLLFYVFYLTLCDSVLNCILQNVKQ